MIKEMNQAEQSIKDKIITHSQTRISQRTEEIETIHHKQQQIQDHKNKAQDHLNETNQPDSNYSKRVQKFVDDLESKYDRLTKQATSLTKHKESYQSLITNLQNIDQTTLDTLYTNSINTIGQQSQKYTNIQNVQQREQYINQSKEIIQKLEKGLASIQVPSQIQKSHITSTDRDIYTNVLSDYQAKYRSLQTLISEFDSKHKTQTKMHHTINTLDIRIQKIEEQSRTQKSIEQDIASLTTHLQKSPENSTIDEITQLVEKLKQTQEAIQTVLHNNNDNQVPSDHNEVAIDHLPPPLRSSYTSQLTLLQQVNTRQKKLDKTIKHLEEIQTTVEQNEQQNIFEQGRKAITTLTEETKKQHEKYQKYFTTLTRSPDLDIIGTLASIQEYSEKINNSITEQQKTFSTQELTPEQTQILENTVTVTESINNEIITLYEFYHPYI